MTEPVDHKADRAAMELICGKLSKADKKLLEHPATAEEAARADEIIASRAEAIRLVGWNKTRDEGPVLQPLKSASRFRRALILEPVLLGPITAGG